MLCLSLLLSSLVSKNRLGIVIRGFDNLKSRRPLNSKQIYCMNTNGKSAEIKLLTKMASKRRIFVISSFPFFRFRFYSLFLIDLKDIRSLSVLRERENAEKRKRLSCLTMLALDSHHTVVITITSPVYIISAMFLFLFASFYLKKKNDRQKKLFASTLFRLAFFDDSHKMLSPSRNRFGYNVAFYLVNIKKEREKIVQEKKKTMEKMEGETSETNRLKIFFQRPYKQPCIIIAVCFSSSFFFCFFFTTLFWLCCCCCYCLFLH